LQLEKAIGKPIGPEVRSKIEVSIYDYLTFATWESTATSASSVIKDVEVIKSAAVAFRNALLVRDGFQARYEIETQLGRPRGYLRGMAVGPIHELVRDCDAVMNRMAIQEGYRPGEAWDRWIWRVTDILKAAGLPTGARKDTDKNKRASSPFVEFMCLLSRCCLPVKFRRHTHSNNAMAEAIGEARRLRGK
jgi:hypothetical protein